MRQEIAGENSVLAVAQAKAEPTLFSRLEARIEARYDWQDQILILTGKTSPLSRIRAWLDEASPPVPHASIDSRPTDTVATLLGRMVDGLTDTDAVGGHPTFPRFRLLERIRAEDLSMVPATRNRQRVLARRLRRPLSDAVAMPADPRREQAESGALDLVQKQAGSAGLVVLWTLVFSVPILFRAWRDRPARRWLLSQQYLTRPDMTFLAFARRLTRHERSADSPDVNLLLVNAVLQDLRSSYRGPRYRWAWRRRTARPVVLIDNCEPGSAGEELLRVMSLVRSADQRGDPLVVIAHARSSTLPITDELLDAEREWRSRLTTEGVTWETDWRVVVRTPPISPTPPPPNVRRPHWAVRRPFVIAVVAAVLLGTLGAGSILASPRVEAARAGCYVPWNPFSTERVSVKYAGGECIGYSGDERMVFAPASPWLAPAQNKVFRENNDVRGRLDGPGGDRHVTIVLLTGATRPYDGDKAQSYQSFIAPARGLDGIGAAQSAANRTADEIADAPYVTVVVANAGDEGRHLDTAVDKLIELKHRDPSFVAVIAAIDSRKGNLRQLQRLGEEGLIIVSASMSAVGVGNGIPNFFTLAPTTADEAHLAHQYVTQSLGRSEVTPVVSVGRHPEDPLQTDLYASTLLEAMHDEFGSGLRSPLVWSRNADLQRLCADQDPGVVFWGGRYSDVQEFLHKLSSTCPGRLPVLVADGSTARYMASSESRANGPYGVPLLYMAQPEVTCHSLAEAITAPARTYYDNLNCKNKNPEGVPAPGQRDADDAGVWSSLSYDAVNVVLQAARQLPSGTAATGDRLAEVVRGWNEAHHNEGVTGAIWFDHGLRVQRRLVLYCVPEIPLAFSQEPPQIAARASAETDGQSDQNASSNSASSSGEATPLKPHPRTSPSCTLSR